MLLWAVVFLFDIGLFFNTVLGGCFCNRDLGLYNGGISYREVVYNKCCSRRLIKLCIREEIEMLGNA